MLSITTIIIILCVINYVMLMKREQIDSMDIALLDCGAMHKPMYDIKREWYRFFTSAFVHMSLPHLLMNMYCLWSIGSLMESVFGPVLYLVLLFGSVVTGNIFVYLMGNEYSISGGMSSGIYGLLAVEITILLANYGIEGITQSPAVLTTLLLNIMMNFMPGVGWKAHLGGACFGVLFVSVIMFL